MDTIAPYQTTSTVSLSSLTPFGTLGNLPPEIRSMIYENLFVRGSVALTRASRALYAESKGSLNKYGACRVRVQQVCGRVDGYYITRYTQDLRLDLIPSHVKTLALTLHLERICYPAARTYHEVDELGDLFSRIVDRLAKPLRCHLTLDFDDLYKKRLDPAKIYRRFDALEVLRRFQAVTVEVSHGRWYNRDRSRALHESHAYYYDSMFAKIKAILAPKDSSDPVPKIAVFRTIRYVTADGWVKYLEDKEEDERIAFQLPERKERLDNDVCYCP